MEINSGFKGLKAVKRQWLIWGKTRPQECIGCTGS